MARLLIIAAALWIGSQPTTWSADRPARVPMHFLLVVDSSYSMADRGIALRTGVYDFIYSGFAGQVRAGDYVYLWSFNEKAKTRDFRMLQWDPMARESLARQAYTYVSRLRFERQTRLEVAVREAGRFITTRDPVNVIFFTDGEERIKGTPFDGEINAQMQEKRRDFKRDQSVFLAILMARKGQYVGWTVGASGDITTFPRLREPGAESAPPPALNPEPTVTEVAKPAAVVNPVIVVTAPPPGLETKPEAKPEAKAEAKLETKAESKPTEKVPPSPQPEPEKPPVPVVVTVPAPQPTPEPAKPAVVAPPPAQAPTPTPAPAPVAPVPTALAAPAASLPQVTSAPPAPTAAVETPRREATPEPVAAQEPPAREIPARAESAPAPEPVTAAPLKAEAPKPIRTAEVPEDPKPGPAAHSSETPSASLPAASAPGNTATATRGEPPETVKPSLTTPAPAEALAVAAAPATHSNRLLYVAMCLLGLAGAVAWYALRAKPAKPDRSFISQSIDGTRRTPHS